LYDFASLQILAPHKGFGPHSALPPSYPMPVSTTSRAGRFA
jgi:hypothetical protein